MSSIGFCRSKKHCVDVGLLLRIGARRIRNCGVPSATCIAHRSASALWTNRLKCGRDAGASLISTRSHRNPFNLKLGMHTARDRYLANANIHFHLLRRRPSTTTAIVDWILHAILNGFAKIGFADRRWIDKLRQIVIILGGIS